MKCKVCGAENPEDFYKSISSYCREHWKEHVRTHRSENAEYYKQYDRARGMLPHRVAARKAYSKTDAGKAAYARSKKKWQANNPKKRWAHNAVNNALRDGKLTKASMCLDCGVEGKVEAHHEDYNRPLDVLWLCPECHRERHKEEE